MIIDEANKVTAERGSKKVEAYHLKHAVETVDMLDFLKEIVEGVPDPTAGGTVDLEPEAGEAGRKRRGGKGKKPAEGDAPAGTRKRRKKGEAKEEGEEGPTAGRRRGKKKEKEEKESEHEQEQDDDAEMKMEDSVYGNGGTSSGVARQHEDDDDDDWEG